MSLNKASFIKRYHTAIHYELACMSHHTMKYLSRKIWFSIVKIKLQSLFKSEHTHYTQAYKQATVMYFEIYQTKHLVWES